MAINWTEEREPNKDSSYNHVISETPLGRVKIEWEGWKDNPLYSVEFGWSNIFVDGRYTLEDAKEYVENYFTELIERIQIFLYD